MNKICVVVGTVLVAVAAVLSLVVWVGDASVDLGLILTVGFSGGAALGVGLLLPRR